ncbi:MAG: prolipoprotein diacylglyceryl transferase [Patescibacteria group bacterium]
MFSWLHNFTPEPILVHFGPISLHWYGLFMALGIFLALITTLKISKYFKIEKEIIWDLSFYLILFGLIGARVYEIFLEFPFYLNHPEQIIKVWAGGLAIHGAIMAGILTIYFLAKKYQINFWKLSAVIVPGLALGQAIGRFGNWFNQELFGLPTSLPWGIPINLENRPLEFISQQFFHPTFLYESLGSIIIFISLLLIIKKYKENLNNKLAVSISIFYLISYSVLRLLLEFIKVDNTPILLGLRWPQIISLLIIITSIIIFKKSQDV